MTAIPLRTPRLLLRGWRDADLGPFAALNADPEVMRHFPAPLSRERSDDLATWAGEGLEHRGWGLWALEERTTGRFIGFTGLAEARFDGPFTPAIEVGWRLERSAWGHGYATEAARAAVAHAFGPLGLDELVSFTAVGNARSRAVMVRLGMSYDPAEDFDHPEIPPGSPLRRHVLHRLRRSAG